jgi:hypothetical protein
MENCNRLAGPELNNVMQPFVIERAAPLVNCGNLPSRMIIANAIAVERLTHA